MGRKIPINTPIHQGWNILWYRSLNDWSQEDLAKESGITQREISDYENMAVIPEDKLQKLANALDTNIRYLRDVASYGATKINYINNNDQPINGDFASQTIHPLETVKDVYETNIARLIEANNKYTYSLERQIEKLEAQLKASK